MKKPLIVILILFSLSLAAFLGWLSSGPGQAEPRFEMARTQPRIGAYKNVHYDFLSPSPFEGGKMWITAIGRTNRLHCYLYDIERRTVLGELLNAGPVFMNGDQSKLLCIRQAKEPWSLGEWLTTLWRRLSRSKASIPSPSGHTATIWVLNLKQNSATRIGKTAGIQSTFQSSPTFRYGYVKPMEYPDRGQLLLCDLQKETSTRLTLQGYPQGWWDDHTLIVKNPTNDFTFYDIVSGKQTPLWSAAQLAEFFDKMHLSGDSTNASCFSIWNGKENDFYLTHLHKKWEAVESFLIKIGRPEPTLNLVSLNFKFEWSDHLDTTGAWYLYTGREAGEGSSAVFLRDMRSNAQRALVPSDGGKYFSIPRFYRDGVIYTRSNVLWRISLDGSNQSRLFPPPETAPPSRPVAE